MRIKALLEMAQAPHVVVHESQSAQIQTFKRRDLVRRKAPV